MATASHTSDAGTTASQSFARFCAGLDYEALPRVAVDRVKHFFIDYIGIALHASTLDSSQPLRKLAAERPIPGGATLLGRPDLVNAHWAAFANGMAAHSMELDDTYLPGSIHNESFVFSPSLALAEERGVSGKRFVAAIVAGFEVACRVAAALQPSATNARGFHPTGTTGALGAAEAAGTLLGLDAEQLGVAIGVACSQAGGLLEFVTDGTWTKRFHGGARRNHRGGTRAIWDDGAAYRDRGQIWLSARLFWLGKPGTPCRRGRPKPRDRAYSAEILPVQLLHSGGQ